ncbi:UNVERIFIED_CONTAM: hypothetical protein PYX00_000546 [Menopon gallinae]|uniref:Nicalin n=1 Tax=Menopon gallinae TaxID=328185 RepID=A0AAW2I914_9NEOP
MWLEDINEFSEIFRGYFPYYLLVVLPIFIVMSPVNPVGAAHEFPVYRMQQYDLHGLPHGCRSSSVNLEARSLTSWSTNRHCVVARFQDITSHKLREIRSKAGALFIVLPKDMSRISQELEMQMMEIEEELLSQEIFIPVYFALWNNELQSVLDDVSSSFITNDKTASATEAFLDAVSANGYQIVINANQPSVRTGVQITNIQGKLSGHGIEENLPTIAIVAHYDSYGAAPELAFGGDSNASGVVVLLELARIFSMLYSNSKTHAPYNFIFLLSGAGKFNYLGSKKWLEDQIDGVESSIVQDAAFVLCLDSLSSNTTLHLHVSKPPKETSSRGLFFQELQNIAGSSNVQMVHKKINLADDFLAWEHERYGIRRLPAITLSALRSHRDLKRKTIFDIRENVDLTALTNNAKTIAQALARLIYNNSKIDIFSDHLGIEMDSVKVLLDYIANQPRSAQLWADKNSPFIYSLKDILGKYCRDVKMSTLVSDKRDPDFVFYDVTQSTVHIYSVKPAVFDLFLTAAIVVYLSLVYLLLNNFSYIYTNVTKIVSSKKKS